MGVNCKENNLEIDNVVYQHLMFVLGVVSINKLFIVNITCHCGKVVITRNIYIDSFWKTCCKVIR